MSVKGTTGFTQTRPSITNTSKPSSNSLDLSAASTTSPENAGAPPNHWRRMQRVLMQPDHHGGFMQTRILILTLALFSSGLLRAADPPANTSPADISGTKSAESKTM